MVGNTGARPIQSLLLQHSTDSDSEDSFVIL